METHGSSLDYGAPGGSLYDSLRVPPDAGLETIRKRFREAVLALHPDKLGSRGLQSGRESGDKLEEDRQRDVAPHPSSEDVSPPQPSDEECRLSKDELLSRYLRVQEAWETLRNPASRLAYDRELHDAEMSKASGGHRSFPADTIGVNDMDQEVASDAGTGPVYSYPCRCGDRFRIEEADIVQARNEVEEDPSGCVHPPISFHLDCSSCSSSIHVVVAEPSSRFPSET